MSPFPPATDLLASVSHFLRDELLPSLHGAQAFNLRVAINAIDLIGRELTLQTDADERERERLTKLLDSDAPLAAMRRELCEKIAAGAMTLEQTAVREHLRLAIVDRLAIDQPTYSAYVAATAGRRGDRGEGDEKSGS
jgi:hypothetical protein